MFQDKYIRIKNMYEKMQHSKKNVLKNDKSEIDFNPDMIMPNCNVDHVKK
jgi:hypothetical protein